MHTKEKEMKKYLLILLITCSGSLAFAQDNQTPYQTKPVSGSVKGVFVQTSGGSITVSGASGESPRVEVYVRGNNGSKLPKEEIEKRLINDYELQVSVANGEIHALAKRKNEDGGWDWKRQLSISFKIYVNKQVNTRLSTSGGSIHLDNLSGEENFETSGGSLHLDHLTGNIKGETSGGSIEVSNSGNNIHLETSGGSIHASGCQGKIHLETSGGSLHLDDLNGSIDAGTSGGSVQANKIVGELITSTSGGSVNLTQLACSVQAETSGGSMNVEILQLGKYVKLGVSGGHVSLRLPSKGMNLNLSANRITPSSSTGNFSGDWDKDHVRGTLNGGGIPVSVDASGRLDISFN